MMTQRDFIALADAARRFKEHDPSPGYQASEWAIEVLAEFCAGRNARFKRSRWLGYIRGECGPSGGQREAE
jgi:hypothetical protein